MLQLNGMNIVMAKPNRLIFEYMDSFFDMPSLVSYMNLTLTGLRKYKENREENIIKAILMCTVHNKDYRKYDMFELKCEEWEMYFPELFTGFDRTDINKAAAKLVAREIEIMKNKEEYNGGF